MQRLRRAFPYLFLVLLIAANLTIWAQRQNIADWWSLRDYHPSANIASLVSDDTMTPYAEHLLYINHPAFESSALFNKNCPSGSEQTIVLGCYHPIENGIFLYGVSDPTLAGVEQVTAAHEMLHAAYDRLSTSEKQYVDGLLMNYYQHELHDQTILTEIAAYKKSEPHDVVNEMHSVFGTEVLQLPAPLEAYYKRYFNDRQKIADYAASYRSAFTTRESQVSQYDAQLSGLQVQIDKNKNDLDSRLANLDSQRSKLNSEASSTDPATYNQDVTSFNASVATYNQELDTTRSLIAQYNTIVGERNAIAVQEQQLQDELDSNYSAPQQQQ